jgi:hypothetical protein
MFGALPDTKVRAATRTVSEVTPSLLEPCTSQPIPAVAPVGALDQVVSPDPRLAWRDATRTPVSSAIFLA